MCSGIRFAHVSERDLANHPFSVLTVRVKNDGAGFEAGAVNSDSRALRGNYQGLAA